ncbi:methyl-accepting chemotaxis protein [Pelagicoccus sp. SDUM812002]|uniref:methyl-accepting chemotaxis protein n=1 Tax=Pelagicoccus sp. SDUM812002 TaxID=3041266 RepID=UPI00280F7F55|nr:methyl-accepting chemotaxis protein [Pelagicoccus sp. SDUM812002]MDQ8185174.1 methyl-accepting chemotaxis protein [Pelagicoccus sp. SDUM812002]
MNSSTLSSMRSQTIVAASIAFLIVAICGVAIFINLNKLLENQKWVAHTMNVTSTLRNLGQSLVDMETGLRGYAVGGQENFLEPYHAGKSNFSEQFDKVYTLVSDNPKQLMRLDGLEQAHEEWSKNQAARTILERKALNAGSLSHEEFEAKFNQAEGKVTMDKMRRLLSEAIEEENALMKPRLASYEQTVSTTKFWSSWGLLAAILVGGGTFAFVTQRTSRTLSSIATAIDLGSNQITSAAQQVGESSQALAEGSSEQASSLEETNAAMSELESKAKKNSEHTNTAIKLSAEARKNTAEGEKSVQVMANAMTEIHTSATEVARIVSTIEDIAFQTNILALNAAVEAARAGEAGSGFAVVADEVRNLAQRSAEAAKQTSQQIENSIARTERGVSISKELSENLSRTLRSFSDVDAIINEIARASDEQKENVTQINQSLVQIDEVSQQAASQSEENASAAEELTAQSGSLQEQIASLMQLAGMTSDGMKKGARSQTTRSRSNEFEINRTSRKQSKEYVGSSDTDFFN